MFLIALLCSDPDIEARQDFLMQRFFHSAYIDFLLRTSQNRIHSNTCDNWYCVKCTSGIVEEINIMGEECGPLKLSYVPPTVQRLTISRCQQFSRLDCRQFSRESVYINMSYNQCQGSLDLSVLPAKLQCLDLMQNELIGPIGLFHLPGTLKKLNVGRNRIEQEVVYYGQLSSAIEGIYLFDNAVGPIKRANDSVTEVNNGFSMRAGTSISFTYSLTP